MTNAMDIIAYNAGFRKIGETNTCSQVDESLSLEIDVISSRIMPEGWIGFRTKEGITCFGPDRELVQFKAEDLWGEYK